MSLNLLSCQELDLLILLLLYSKCWDYRRNSAWLTHWHVWEQVSTNNGRFYWKVRLLRKNIRTPWKLRLYVPYPDHSWLRFHPCLNEKLWWSSPGHSGKCHSQHPGSSVTSAYSNGCDSVIVYFYYEFCCQCGYVMLTKLKSCGIGDTGATWYWNLQILLNAVCCIIIK